MVYYVNKISDLSDFEYISIIIAMEIMRNEVFRCDICSTRAPEARRISFGCKKPSKDPKPIIHYNHRIDCYTCPGNLYEHSVENLLYIHSKFEQGIMPYGGTLMDQPAKFIQSMQLIDAVNSRIKEELKKKNTRK